MLSSRHSMRSAGPTRSGRPHRWSRARRPAQVALVCGLVAATLSTTETSAQALPEQVLQSVRVEVAPDGSITAVQSEAVRRAGEGEPTSEVEELSPSDVAGELPVRVQTSYRLGERSGTDLRDIEGEAGRVVIQVTVQNTTVRPEQVEYQTSEGNSRTVTALVGTPLTVVGSAQLGEGELARVVTSNDETGEITDGVVSRGDDGRAQVQWAAMLAPPRLAPSATFTLVEETADFQVPAFDFSVQPGLVTDASVSKLIDSAFSADGESALELESRTIEIIGSVNTVLADAGTVLGDIQGTLDQSAADLGQRTVGELRAGRDRVDGSLTATVAQLEALDGDIARELEANQSETLARLGATIDGIKSLLGTPATTPQPDLRYDATCGDYRVRDARDGDPGTSSVLYRMRLVGAQLEALSDSSRACRDEIVQGLRDAVGSTDASCIGGATGVTAICALLNASSQLSSQSARLSAFGEELKSLTPRQSMNALSTKLTAVLGELSEVRTASESLRGSVYVAGDLSDGALGIRDALLDVLDVIDADDPTTVEGLDFDGLRQTRDDIVARADQQLALIGTPLVPDSVSANVATLGAKLRTACTLVDLATTEAGSLPELIVDFLSNQTEVCEGVENGPDGPGLITRLDNQLGQLRSAWGEVRTDAGGIGSEVDRLEGLRDDLVEDLETNVDALNTLLGDAGNPTEVEQRLLTLFDDIAAMYQPAPSVPADACGPLPEPAPRRLADPPVANQLQDAFEQVNCETHALLQRVDSQVREFQDVVEVAADDVDRSAVRTDRARSRAEGTVGRLTDRFSKGLGDAGDEVLGATTQRIGEGRESLTQSYAAAKEELAALTQGAAARLSEQVGASTRDLDATNRQLAEDLARVLLDLGTRGEDGTGILGTLSTSASRTGLANADIAGAARRASSFRSIRSQVVSDIRLQQAQLDRSLERTTQLPSLGLDVEPGSRVLTVYTFHVGA
jgi:trimeric autotransporter adhesin